MTKLILLGQIQTLSSLARRSRREIKKDNSIKEYLKGNYNGFKFALVVVIASYKAVCEIENKKNENRSTNS